MNALPQVIEGRYFGDIMAQPQALSDMRDWLAGSGRREEVVRFIGARPWRRIVLTGMGSSFHTLHPLNIALIAAGHTPVMIETAELVHYGMALCDEQSLVIAVSQSGSSAETVRLLELNTRAPVLGVTNTAGSPLARRSGLALLSQAGPEHSVSCKTYVSGMLALQWLATAFSGEAPAATLDRLAAAPGLVAQYLRGWQAHTQELAARLRGMRHLFLTGRGPSLASAGTGALIL